MPNDYVSVSKRFGPDFYEFGSIIGFKGVGAGMRYKVLWRDGSITFEPSKCLPKLALKKFRKELAVERVNKRRVDELGDAAYDFMI